MRLPGSHFLRVDGFDYVASLCECQFGKVESSIQLSVCRGCSQRPDLVTRGVSQTRNEAALNPRSFRPRSARVCRRFLFSDFHFCVQF